jgi:hypothetical protein
MIKGLSRIFAAAMAAGLGILAGCSDGTSGVTAGQMSIQLTDAPFPFDQVASVNVFIIRVDANPVDVSPTDASNVNDNNGWTTVASPNALFNLMDLVGGKTTSLGAATLASGVYRGLRLIIDTDKSSVTLKPGNTPVDVKWPSAGQSGIKLLLDQPVDVTPAGAIVIVDFDIGRSFVMRGNSISQNGLLFNPVIHATVPDLSGSVSGSVRALDVNGTGVPGTTVEVLKAGTALGDLSSANVVRTGGTDASGNFLIKYIAPGTYELRATPPVASTYKPALLAGGLTITSKTETSGKVIVVNP